MLPTPDIGLVGWALRAWGESHAPALSWHASNPASRAGRGSERVVCTCYCNTVPA